MPDQPETTPVSPTAPDRPAGPTVTAPPGLVQAGSSSTFSQDDRARAGPAPAPPAEWPARAGRYVIEQEVARGGMGAVLRAHDPDLDRPLALKVLLGRSE